MIMKVKTFGSQKGFPAEEEEGEKKYHVSKIYLYLVKFSSILPERHNMTK